MPIVKGVRYGLNSTTMEGMNYLSPSDVMMMTKRHDNRGLAATALGIGAGALALGIAGWLGLNAASQARNKGNQKAIDMISQFVLSERTSREAWQNQHAPTLTQYVDVSAGAGAGANANALAAAYAINGINSAIGHDSFLKVQRYSAPQPCGCE